MLAGQTDSAMRIISPEFSFRGNRDYINAASIYEAIIDNTRGAGLPDVDGEVRLTIRKLMRKQLEIHYGDPSREIPKPPEATVDFKIVAGGAAVFGWMTETDRVVIGRTPYDEEEMAALGTIEGTLLRVEGMGPYSPAQVATSSARRLHDALIPPAKGQKWLFVNLGTVRPLGPSDLIDMTLEITRNVHNVLTRTTLRKSGDDIGHFGFSLVSA